MRAALVRGKGDGIGVALLEAYDEFRNSGASTVQPVPDSIHFFGDQLLVSYLTGFPFGPGAAQVRIVDATSGHDEPFITRLTAAID